MAAVSASHVSRRRNTRANAEVFMKTKTIASALGLLAAATLLVADGAHAGRFGGDHDDGAAHAGGFHGSARPGCLDAPGCLDTGVPDASRSVPRPRVVS